jgi:hypothetical protein
VHRCRVFVVKFVRFESLCEGSWIKFIANKTSSSRGFLYFGLHIPKFSSEVSRDSWITLYLIKLIMLWFFERNWQVIKNAIFTVNYVGSSSAEFWLVELGMHKIIRERKYSHRYLSVFLVVFPNNLAIKIQIPV